MPLSQENGSSILSEDGFAILLENESSAIVTVETAIDPIAIFYARAIKLLNRDDTPLDWMAIRTLALRLSSEAVRVLPPKPIVAGTATPISIKPLILVKYNTGAILPPAKVNTTRNLNLIIPPLSPKAVVVPPQLPPYIIAKLKR